MCGGREHLTQKKSAGIITKKFTCRSCADRKPVTLRKRWKKRRGFNRDCVCYSSKYISRGRKLPRKSLKEREGKFTQN